MPGVACVVNDKALGLLDGGIAAALLHRREQRPNLPQTRSAHIDFATEFGIPNSVIRLTTNAPIFAAVSCAYFVQRSKRRADDPLVPALSEGGLICRQFFTVYLVLYFGVTLLFIRAAMVVLLGDLWPAERRPCALTSQRHE
ncbi:MAG: hypothetical protein ACI9OJ_003797 [Myxococcota bacterium]